MKNNDYNGAGVYRITIGGRVYIGSSICVRSRIQQHRTDARAGKEPKNLQQLYDDGHDMHVDILEELDDNKTIYDLRQAEQRWIDRQDNPLNVMRPGNINPMKNVGFLVDHVTSVLQLIKRSENFKYKRKLLLSASRDLAAEAAWLDLVTSPIGEVRKRGRRQKETGDKRQVSTEAGSHNGESL